MTPLFHKLNLKDQNDLHIFYAPESFNQQMSAMEQIKTIHQTIQDINVGITFLLIFVLTEDQIRETIQLVYPHFEGDATIWFAYPKKTSKKYSCSFNRDTGWAVLGKYNLEPVRMVAIDQDWSALRFRKVEFIKKLTRNESMFLSEKGKQKNALDTNE